jgi:hypothetical protein
MSFEPGLAGVHQDRPLPRRAKNRLSGLVIDFVSMVKAGDNPSARVVLMKRHPDGDQDGADSVDKQDNGDQMERDEALQGAPDAVVAYVEALEDAVLKAEEERDEALDKAKAPPFTPKDGKKDEEDDEDKDEMEKVLKGIEDPVVRAVLLKQQMEIDKAHTEAAEAKAAAQVEKDARTRMVLKTRVEQQMGHLGDVDETVDLLAKVAKGLDADTYGALEKVLTTASNQAELGGLFKEIGNPGFNGAAVDPLSAEATKIQKAEPDLTWAMAMDKAMEQNPQLYYQSIQVGGDS